MNTILSNGKTIISLESGIDLEISGDDSLQMNLRGRGMEESFMIEVHGGSITADGAYLRNAIIKFHTKLPPSRQNNKPSRKTKQNANKKQQAKAA